MKNLYILLLSATTLFASCLSDDGNYDYKTLSDVNISGLDDSYRFILQNNVSLHPQISTDINADHLSYCWRIGADTLATTKDLDWVFKRIPTNSKTLTFEVYDKTTDVRYTKQMSLNVVSPFYSGWLMLADENGRGVLDFQSYEADKKMYHDVYKEVNGKDLSGTPLAVKQVNYQDGFTGGYEDRVVVVNKGGKSVDLDGTSMVEYVAFEDQFKSDEKPSTLNITAEYYNSDKALCLVTADGEVYGKTPGGMATPEDGYFQYPYRGDGNGYRVAPFLVRAGYTSYYYGLDELNHRFVCFLSSYLSSTVSPVVWDRTASIQNVDLDKVEGTALWMGSFLYNENVYSVIKKTDGYWLYRFSVIYDGTATLTACVKLPDGLIDDKSLFQVHPTSPYLFVTKGNQLSALNLENLSDISGAVNPIATYDGDITAMSYAYDRNKNVNEFAIAVQSSASESTVMLVDPQLTAHGNILQKWTGIKGKVLSLCRKIM